MQIGFDSVRAGQQTSASGGCSSWHGIASVRQHTPVCPAATKVACRQHRYGIRAIIHLHVGVTDIVAVERPNETDHVQVGRVGDRTVQGEIAALGNVHLTCLRGAHIGNWTRVHAHVQIDRNTDRQAHTHTRVQAKIHLKDTQGRGSHTRTGKIHLKGTQGRGSGPVT